MAFDAWNLYGGSTDSLKYDNRYSTTGSSSLFMQYQDYEAILILPQSETDAPMEGEVRGQLRFSGVHTSCIGGCYFRFQDLNNHYSVVVTSGNVQLWKRVNGQYTLVDDFTAAQYSDEVGGRTDYFGWGSYRVIFWEDDTDGSLYSRVFVMGSNVGRDLQDLNPDPNLTTGGGIGFGGHTEQSTDAANTWFEEQEIYY